MGSHYQDTKKSKNIRLMSSLGAFVPWWFIPSSWLLTDEFATAFMQRDTKAVSYGYVPDDASPTGGVQEPAEIPWVIPSWCAFRRATS